MSCLRIDSSGPSGIALYDYAQFVFGDGKFLGKFRLAAIQADVDFRKDEHQGRVPRMNGNFCRESTLSFRTTRLTRHSAPLSTPKMILRFR